MSADITVIPGGSQGQYSGGSLVDLDFGSVSDFRKRLFDMKQKLDFMKEFFKEVMVKDEDYGVIPGTNKPTLYKPGAEKLCELYGFAAHLKEKEEEKDYETGYYRATITIQLIHRSTGVVVGEGVGECNTNESKYRYRWVYENKIPRHLNKDDLYYEEKDEWRDGQKTGNTYRHYRIPNEDLFSQWNTVLKMAYKRAFTGVTLQCTRSSGIFTQEEEEMDEWADVPEEDRKKQRGRTGGGQYGGNRSANSSQGGGRSSGGGGMIGEKNRALELVKLIRGQADWNWLAEQASEALGRKVTKVVQDVKDTEWKVIADFIDQNYGGQGDFDLPEDLR